MPIIAVFVAIVLLLSYCGSGDDDSATTAEADIAAKPDPRWILRDDEIRFGIPGDEYDYDLSIDCAYDAEKYLVYAAFESRSRPQMADLEAMPAEFFSRFDKPPLRVGSSFVPFEDARVLTSGAEKYYVSISGIDAKAMEKAATTSYRVEVRVPGEGITIEAERGNLVAGLRDLRKACEAGKWSK
ncbi:hypothetical protein VQ042_20845 [Aurantimonas sp. A2-1-M11]|uniref:hypothetical protein n=1 Tax=Aurantimonas sp. A2-1-M11 TaxID=3113712 RepID=UPI002F924A3B